MGDLKSRMWSLLAAGLIAAGVVACDQQETAAGGASAAGAPARAEPVFGSGVLRGAVKFVGEAPVMAEIANEPCHADAEPLKEETVIVNPNGTLANVFVYLEGVAPSDGSARQPALLDQVNCRYTPHAVAVQVGQTLIIRSSDPTLHNVHYNAAKNPPANFGLTVKGAEKQVKFEASEFVRVKCDVHPWMTAYVGIFNSPFFAVSSDSDGGFEISGVPAGAYKLIAWHERYGTLEQPVEVKDDQVVDVTLTYSGPS